MDKIKISVKPKIRVLELFKGTGSVEKAIKKLYPNAVIISNDIMAKYNPTILGDFMDLDYKQWKPNHFDIVWASPPCTYYSQMQRFIKRDISSELEHSNRMVKRVLECIDYLKPKRWYIENPQSGTLKNQSFMMDIPYCDATYCMYGYRYRKQTRFWTNVPKQLKICSRSKKGEHCPIFDENIGKHPMAIGRSGDKNKRWYATSDNSTLEERYSIPQDLLHDLLRN